MHLSAPRICPSSGDSAAPALKEKNLASKRTSSYNGTVIREEPCPPRRPAQVIALRL